MDASPQDPLEAAIDQCAVEPIHIPGSVQPHGVLFSLDDDLRIQQVSANSRHLLEKDADALLGTPVLDLVVPETRNSFERLIREAAFTYVNPFRVTIPVRGGVRYFDGIAHMIDGLGTVLELEMDPSEEASARPSTEGIDNYLQIVQRSLEMIAGVADVVTIADVMAREIKAFTGFDRVMVYRFAPDFHGEVIAESVENDMEPFLGLHYPASDIPAQARELYLKNHVRLLQDVDAVPVPLLPELHPTNGAPLDMSRAVLRAMSPIHVQYLKNMGVGASLSISLVVEDKLWGLIACHHRTARFVSYAIRATSCLYAIVLSAQLKVKQRNLENHRIASARRMALSILTGLRDYSEPMGSLPSMLPRFMELFAATGAALISRTDSFRYGSTPEEHVLADFHSELGDGSDDGVRISSRACREFRALENGGASAAGIVAIHLGATDWLVLFRVEMSRQVTWAGDPRKPGIAPEDGPLRPRNSFSAWLEEVRGESEPWPEETAALTSEVRTGILEILRKRNIILSRSNQDLRRFAGLVAHEVKNHLQTGIFALSLLEERIAQFDPAVQQLATLGRERLDGLSKFTNDMLAFSQTETTTPEERFDLGEMAREIVHELDLSGATEGAVIIIKELPEILAPRIQVRHLTSNLIRNALIHARHGGRLLTIEVSSRKTEEGTVVQVRDDGRGIPEDQQKRIFDYFYRGDTSNDSGTGIGLAFCAQVVERMGHRLWVESVQPTGTAFCFTVTSAA
jgi:chemotaxis family two-component system sensor kinase Cph1